MTDCYEGVRRASVFGSLPPGAKTTPPVSRLVKSEAGCHNCSYEGGANAYRCGAEPVLEFCTAAVGLVAWWVQYGFEREVGVAMSTSGQRPDRTRPG